MPTTNFKNCVSQVVIPLSHINKVEVAENLEFAKATMRVEAVEQQIDGSVTPDEYYFSFAGDPHEVARTVQASASHARQLVLEAGRSLSNTPQGHANMASTQVGSSPSETEAVLKRQDSKGSSGSSSPGEMTRSSMLLDQYTYPPSVSGLPEPRSVTSSGDGAWTTWIRKQPRKVLGVPAKLPFAGRLPFAYWGQDGQRGTSSAFDGAAAIASDDEADMVEEIDLLSKEREFLKTTFGLGDREEVIYRKYLQVHFLPGVSFINLLHRATLLFVSRCPNLRNPLRYDFLPMLQVSIYFDENKGMFQYLISVHAMD